jgi:hypothetical protein
MRFDLFADDRSSAARYLYERAHQLLIDRVSFTGRMEPLVFEGAEWGLRAHATDDAGTRYQSVYVYASQRGKGHWKREVRDEPPIVTTPGCQLEGFLLGIAARHRVVARITGTPEYLAIEQAYGTRTAARSGVLLMRHIDEGLAVLQRLGASDAALRAFCLHPLLQLDRDLAANRDRVAALTTAPVLELALEYRRVANATLSHRQIEQATEIERSATPEVNQMLIADKVQNRKDFLRYHRGVHPRSDALDQYFARWLERLEISERQFAAWSEELVMPELSSLLPAEP